MAPRRHGATRDQASRSAGSNVEGAGQIPAEFLGLVRSCESRLAKHPQINRTSGGQEDSMTHDEPKLCRTTGQTPEVRPTLCC